MLAPKFDNVTVFKESNKYFNNSCISHTLLFADGIKKTIGVILPTPKPLVFNTSVAERMEIISGKCQVRITGKDTFEQHDKGSIFYVEANSSFEIIALDAVDYVCHFED